MASRLTANSICVTAIFAAPEGTDFTFATVKSRNHFKRRIDRLDAAGEIFEHVAGAEDFELAVAV